MNDTHTHKHTHDTKTRVNESFSTAIDRWEVLLLAVVKRLLADGEEERAEGGKSSSGRVSRGTFFIFSSGDTGQVALQPHSATGRYPQIERHERDG